MIPAACSRVATLLSLCRSLRGDAGPHGRRSVVGPAVVRLAIELGVAPALWCAVKCSGQEISPAEAKRLHELYRDNSLRNLRLRSEVIAAVRALNRARIGPLLIKGALELVEGSWERLGERWIGDIDLAVPAAELAGALDALDGIGYRRADAKPFLHPHEVPLVRDRSVAPIEVHGEIGTSRLAPVLPAAEAWSRSVALSFDGAQARGLSPTDQVLHCILHSAVQDRSHAVGEIPLGKLLILSRLVRAHGAAIDWIRIRDRMAAHGLSRELTAHLWLAQDLVGMPSPDGANAATSAARLHELRALISFGLPQLIELQRNVRFVFGPEYLRWLYSYGERPWSLGMARARHIYGVVRRDRFAVMRQAAERKM